jgi:hypothetical protein
MRLCSVASEEKDDWSVEIAVGIELDLDGWDIFGFFPCFSSAPSKDHTLSQCYFLVFSLELKFQ